MRLGILLACCLSGAIRATTLPAPSTLAECSGSFGVIDDPNSCVGNGTNAVGSASVTTSPFVSLTAQTNSGPADQNGVYGAGALATLQYSFQVIGGTPGDVVPILIAGSLSSNGSSFSHAYGFAEVVVHTSFGNTSEVVCTNGTCGTMANSFSGTFGWTATSGEGGDTIQLTAEANSGDSPFVEFANASADPYIYIDPSFANAANYSILVSPGVGNDLPDVPEPATFGLTGAALLMLVRLGTGSRILATCLTNISLGWAGRSGVRERAGNPAQASG